MLQSPCTFLCAAARPQREDVNCFQQRDFFTWAEFSWPKNLACFHTSFSRGGFCCSLVQTGRKADRATSAWQRLEDTHFFAFFFILQAFLSQRLMYWRTTGFWLLENETMEEWGMTADVLSEFRCFLSGWAWEKKYGGHQNVILKINTSMSSEFSLPLKHRHRPFVNSVPRIWILLSPCCFRDFKPLESSALFYFVKHRVLLGIINL